MKKILFLASAIFFFTGCKKEVNSLDKTIMGNEKIQISKELKIFERDNPNSFLIVKMKSENEKLLDQTYEKLINSYIELIEDNPKDPLNIQSISSEISDSIGINYDLNWDNFKFKQNQNKLFFISIQDKIAKTQTFLYTLPNIVNFTTTSGFCIVAVQNTYSYFNLGCLCRKGQTWWNFYNQNNFNLANKICGKIIERNDYLETQTFIDGGINQYIMRLNYTGSERPSGATLINSIKAGDGIDYNRGGQTPANISFWKWL